MKSFQWPALAAISFTLVLSGCGEGGTQTSGEVTLTVTSSNPTMNKPDVGLAETVTVTFATALKADSVNSKTVMLMPQAVDTSTAAANPHANHSAGQTSTTMPGMTNPNVASQGDEGEMDQIRGQASLGADGKTITFTPSQHYENGTTYTLRLHGVKTADGRPVKDTMTVPVVTFTTLHNHRLTDERFNDAGVVTEKYTRYYRSTPGVNNMPVLMKITKEVGGQITEVELRGVMVGGVHAHRAIFSGSTPDTTAFSNLTEYHAAVTDATGAHIGMAWYKDKGSDNAWGGGNDGISRFVRTRHKHENTNFGMNTEYVPVSGATAPWPAGGVDSLEAPGSLFKVDRISVIDHNLDDPNAIDHRHVIYKSLGSDKTLDISGNKLTKVNDEITTWHQRLLAPITLERREQNTYSEASGALLTLNPTTDGQYLTRKIKYNYDNSMAKMRTSYETYGGAGATTLQSTTTYEREPGTMRVTQRVTKNASGITTRVRTYGSPTAANLYTDNYANVMGGMDMN